MKQVTLRFLAAMLTVVAVLLFGSTTWVRADLNAGLVAYLPLNGNANDVSGNGNNGTVGGNPNPWTSDRFGNSTSAYYSANDDAHYYARIAMPYSPSLSTPNITVSMWITVNSYFPGNEIGWELVSNYGWQTSPYAGYQFFLDNQSRLNLALSGCGAATSASQIPLHQWVHVAASYDGAVVRVYVNGVQSGVSACTNYVWNAMQSTIIGNLSYSPYNDPFDGNIDEVRIYNRALSGTEVAQLYGSLPHLSVTPNTTTTYGSLLVGSTRDLTFQVSNVGTNSISGSASVGAPFSVVSGGSYTLTPGQSITTTIRYAPVAAGSNTAYVNFTGGNGQTWKVTGSAYDTPTGITVTSPNGGEAWTADSTRTITWSVIGDTSQINYFWTAYSLDGGATYVNITTAAPAVRSINWNIPAGISSSQVLVRIRALDATGSILASSASSANFSITPSGTTIRARPVTHNAPNAGKSVTFDGSTSTPSAGAVITSYQWNFGDNATATGTTVTHAFSPSVTTNYTVQLTIQDSLGQSDTRTIPVTVTGLASGSSSQSSKSSDPVNLATGNYIYDHTDLRLPGRGLPFEFKRTYNSQDTTFTVSPLGPHWTHSYNIFLSNAVSNVVIVYGDAHSESYTTNGGAAYRGERGVHSSLTNNGNGTFTLTTKEQMKYSFSVTGSVGRLNFIADKNGNTNSLTYNGTGNLISITDTVGRQIAFSLDVSNRITQIIDPLSRTNQFTYDVNGDLVAATDARGGTTHYLYDTNHQMTAATDPNGNQFVHNVYDSTHRVVLAQQDALGGQTQFDYDFETRLTTVTDALGNKTYHQHDSLLRITAIADALGNTASFEYDADNNRTAIIDKRGKVTTYAYDARGNVILKIDPLLNMTSIVYDGLNNPVSRVDALAGTTAFTYDGKGNLTGVVDALGNSSSTVYDGFGEPVSLTDANGHSITNAFNPQGLLAQTKDALGNTTAFNYDSVGRRLSQTNANNKVTLFTYDNNDNLVVATDPLGNSVTNVFDNNNNRIRSVDARGNQTTYGYDAKDRLVSIQDALSGITSNVFDALDRKIKIIDARNAITQYDYDAIGSLVRITDALSNVTTYGYDPNGNRTSVTNALGRTTNYAYDELNRLIQTIDPLGNPTTQQYDALGRRTTLIDANSRTNSFAHDALGRLVVFTDARGGTVFYAYDNVGNRIATTDPNGHTTTISFDAANRLIAKLEPTGNYQYGYDGVGNRTSLIDANGRTMLYTYDGNNRLTRVDYPTGSPVTFGYDANGNRTNMTDNLGGTSYQYDVLNRMTTYVNSNGKSVGYGYDANGNRTSLVYPDGKTVTYSYDTLNRLAAVTDWLSRLTGYSYDAVGNLTGSTNPNSTACAYAYDAASRLTGLTNTAPDLSVISGYSFTLDGVGNHTQAAQTEPLTPVIPPQNVAYAYDNDNRLTTAGGTNYTYDTNGNLTGRGNNSLTYDYENRLTQANIGVITNQYLYDGIGNRLANTQTGVTKRYVLDLNRSLSQVLAETDASGSITAYYVYGLGLIARVTPADATAYYHYDVRGSTIALSDSTGLLTDKYAYDPFGKISNSTGLSTNSFKYVGRYGVVDDGNRLSYIRARYYSPELGRYVTKDPTSGLDGDSQKLNQYIYVLNNPIRFVDLNGFNIWLEGPSSSGTDPEPDYGLLGWHESVSVTDPNKYNRTGYRSFSFGTDGNALWSKGYVYEDKQSGGKVLKEIETTPEEDKLIMAELIAMTSDDSPEKYRVYSIVPGISGIFSQSICADFSEGVFAQIKVQIAKRRQLLSSQNEVIVPEAKEVTSITTSESKKH